MTPGTGAPMVLGPEAAGDAAPGGSRVAACRERGR